MFSFSPKRVCNNYKWSYVSNPGQEPLKALTIGEALNRADELYGHREAVVSVHQGIRCTYSQLKIQVIIVYIYNS